MLLYIVRYNIISILLDIVRNKYYLLDILRYNIVYIVRNNIVYMLLDIVR